MPNPKISISDPRVRVLGPADQPFNIEDSILAFALHMALTPFYDDNWPCVNHYSMEQLRELGYEGLKPQEAAIRAVREGNKGTVTYMFRQPDAELVEAFNDEKRLIESGEGLARDRVKVLMETYKVNARSYAETMVRLMAIVVYMRVEFLTMWKGLEALIQLDTPKKKSERRLHDGSRVLETTGFRFIGAHAGQATKDKLGV
jgi:hypothetical protein